MYEYFIVAGCSAAAGILLTLAVVGIVVACRRRRRAALKVTLQRKDHVLRVGQVYVVGDKNKKGQIKADKYTVLAADETTGSFQIRLGGLVKEYRHNSQIVLAAGDEISPRSANIILRK